MGRAHIGELEELVLLAVAALQQNAYAVSIRSEIEERAGRKINISAIQASLYRLDDKGFLTSYMGESTNKRGGKSKRIFEVTKAGYEVLKKAKDIRQSFWGSIPQFAAE
ncbi:MAG: hypothetical protein Roseis2KO_33460 [Roseivirga sp.]